MKGKNLFFEVRAVIATGFFLFKNRFFPLLNKPNFESYQFASTNNKRNENHIKVMLKRKAVIVGINKYSKSPLKCCVNDARDVRAILEKNEDGSQNFECNLIEDIKSKATLKGILLRLFAEQCDIALFYFAGHGREDRFGFHLVMPDGHENDWGISMTDLLIIANESNANNKVIVLDCCYAGGFGSSKTSSGVAIYMHEGITILASAKDKQKAYEINGHGVFTNLFIEALNGGAADLNGNTSPGSIYAYIDKAMGVGEQRPVFKTNVSEFVSLRKVTPPVPPQVLKKLVKYFKHPQFEFSLNPSFEYTNSPAVEHDVVKPYAKTINVTKFKDLQKMESVGLVVPVGTPHMYFAAMEKKSCQLTPLGKHYWELVKRGRL